jgi:K+-sensing histidine kinase KdpD
VKSVVDAHGGQIQVRAQEPTGTLVTLELPADITDAASSYSRRRPFRFYRSRRAPPRE